MELFSWAFFSITEFLVARHVVRPQCARPSEILEELFFPFLELDASPPMDVGCFFFTRLMTLVL